MEVKSLSVSFGQKVIFDNFNLSFGAGVTAILGPSGVGKTTLLKALAGLIDYSGDVVKGKVGYVFQEPRLIPNLTVLGNIKLIVKDESLARDIIKRVELEGFEKYYPHQLSGGMAQRLNLARAFAYGGDILMDEAFKELDFSLKKRLMDLFLTLQDKSKSAVLVTHDIDEALYLADRILVFNGEPCSIVLDLPKDTPDIKERVYNIINTAKTDL